LSAASRGYLVKLAELVRLARRRCRLSFDRPARAPPLGPTARQEPRGGSPVRRCRCRDDCDEPHFVGRSLDGRFKLGEQRRRWPITAMIGGTTSLVVGALPASRRAKPPVGP
jgi:hypothetical protein